MTAEDVLNELEPLGKESYRKVLHDHNVPEPLFGVKIEELKKIQKRVKKNYELSLSLFDTGIYDAMYLAGLIADDSKMTKKDLRRWATKATCPMLREYTVAWVAAESNHGLELAREWIESTKEGIASVGWATLGGLVSIRGDADLDLDELKELLERVEKSIHEQPNRVRYVMNNFIIAVGSYVKSLTKTALETADRMGEVTVDMGDTSCLVPSAREKIEKVVARGAVGKKRKTVKC